LSKTLKAENSAPFWNSVPKRRCVQLRAGRVESAVDGYTRALILFFSDVDQVAGIDEGQQFRFRCTVMHFDYQYVRMDDCVIVP